LGYCHVCDKKSLFIFGLDFFLARSSGSEVPLPLRGQ
jgi:hypothetical protein